MGYKCHLINVYINRVNVWVDRSEKYIENRFLGQNGDVRANAHASTNSAHDRLFVPALEKVKLHQFHKLNDPFETLLVRHSSSQNAVLFLYSCLFIRSLYI